MEIMVSSADIKAHRRRMSTIFQQQEADAVVFGRKKHFILYIIDQVNLLTEMCRGRCVNAIRHLETYFSYTLLMNMASNPWLPFRFRAAIVHLVLVLYVDRYPQLPKCGATQLPEAIWIFEDDQAKVGQPKKSTMMVLNPAFTLQNKDAFPGFFIPQLSMAHGKADPVISMHDHTKFFLLRSLCNDMLQTDGIVYDDMGDGGLNELTAALLTGQAYLLEFGFQSTIEKVQEICKTNAMLLDGRNDLVRPNQPFSPPERRFNDMGQHSEAVVGIKLAIIDEFFALADLRVNYRLALLLGEFKRKFKRLKEDPNRRRRSSVSAWVSARQAELQTVKAAIKATKAAASLAKNGAGELVNEEDTIAMIASWAFSFDVYAMFEGLFQKVLPRQNDDGGDSDDDSDETLFGAGHGAGIGRGHFIDGGGTRHYSKHDSHTLQFSILAGKPDFEEALIDNCLYDNDELMSASLHLLDVNYGMRRRLVASLSEVVLLEGPSIAVFGDVHSLRSNINELAELVATHTVWCVNSLISGDFDQAKYGRVMSVVDMLIEFIFTPEKDDHDANSDDLDGSINELHDTGADSRQRKLSGDLEPLPLPPVKSPKEPVKETAPAPDASKSGALTKERLSKLASGLALSTAVFIDAVEKHFGEHPEYGTTDELRCMAFFTKMESSGVSDGLLNLRNFTDGMRSLLGLSVDDLTATEMYELFKAIGNGVETVDCIAFENFVVGNSDKANYSGRFIDCDPSADGSYYRVDRVWSTDVAAKWLNKTRPLSTRIETAPNASIEAVAAGKVAAKAAFSPFPGSAAATTTTGVRITAGNAWQYAEVAATGGRAINSGSMKPCKFHQDLLRQCNLQRVLSEAILIDPDIGFKGSQCTIGLKVESQRRLTLVSRALSMLYKSFVDENSENQEIMFKDLSALQKLATPAQLKGGGMDDVFDERRSDGPGGIFIEDRHFACFCVMGGKDGAAREIPTTKTASHIKRKPPPPQAKSKQQAESKNEKDQVLMAPSRAWPTTVQEMAQDSILALLRGNEVLCLRIAENEVVRDSLFGIFTFVVNNHGVQEQRPAQRKAELKVAIKRRKSVDRARKLRFRDLQKLMHMENTKDDEGAEDELLLLTSCDTSPALDFFFIMCAPTASRPLPDLQIQVVKRLCDLSRFDPLARSCASCIRRVRKRAMVQQLKSDSLSPQEAVENPYRMVRLLKACCQGGNDKAAMLFVGASSMIGVEECCHALLAHCPQIPAPAQFAQSNVPPVFTGLGDEDGGEETKSCVESSASIMNGDRILKMLAPHSRLVASAETIEDQPLSHAVKKDQAKKSKEQKKRVSSVLRNFSFSSSADRPSISFFGANKSSQKSEQSDQEAIDLKTAEKTMQVKVGVATLTVSECFEDGSLIERGAFEVLALLVELVDLLPLSASQLRSPLLWECVSTVCLPAVDELALRREFGVENDDVEGSQGSDLSHLTCERIVCAELVDLMDCLLTRIDHHNLVEDLLAEQYSNGTPLVDDIRGDLKTLAVQHQSLPDIFSSRTREAVERFFLRCDDMSEAIPVQKYFRKDPHIYGLHHSIVHHKRFSTVARAAIQFRRNLNVEQILHRNNSEQHQQNKSQRSSRRGVGGMGGGDVSNSHARRESLYSRQTIDGEKSQEQLIEERLGLGASFQAFRNGIKTNPHVDMAIMRRRFALLTVLEKGTQPDPVKFRNQSSGIVAVTWEMLVARFLRYLREPIRFDADNSSLSGYRQGSETCHIILRLLRDHLVKARTLPLDRHGTVVLHKHAKIPSHHHSSSSSSDGKAPMKTRYTGPLVYCRHYDHPRVVELRTVYSSNLPLHHTRSTFVHKQNALAKLGCVEVVARIMMAVDGDLADEALEVLNELNHGCNTKVRKCLHDLLTTEDREGHFLAHLVLRMENANATLQEGRNFGLLGQLGRNISDDMKVALTDARQTVRFLINLCLGHHAEFQNILREQPMYNARTYDLVGMCLDLLCSMADSQHAVKYMGEDELELLRDLLKFVYQVAEGPNEANQLKIAESDLPMAINLIVASEPIVESRLSKQEANNGRVTLDALCYRAVSACLEGRRDQACHFLLREHVDMPMLYEKARALDSKCRVAIARSKTSFLATSASLELQQDHTVQLSGDLDNLAKLWTIHSELFPEMSDRRSRRRLIGRSKDLVRILNQAIGDEDDNHDGDEAAPTAADNYVDKGKVAGATSGASPPSSPLRQEQQQKQQQEEERRGCLSGSKACHRFRGCEKSSGNNGFGRFGIDRGMHDANEFASDDDTSSDEEEESSSGQQSGGGGGEEDKEYEGLDDAKALNKRELVGMVEVAWRGKTQRVCFPMPLQARNLTEKTKRTFLDKTRLYTTDKRLEILFESSDLFIAEMDLVYSLTERSKVYRLIGRHFGSLRLLMYSLVVLLNVNVLMSPPSLSHPINAMFGDGNYAALDSNERLSLLITFSLGLLNFVGYFVIMGNVALTTLPVIVCEMDKNISRNRKTLEATEWTNIRAFKWWFVTLVFNVMFILMHATNFPQYVDQSTGLYIFLIFGINLPWTLSCLRNYIVVPTTATQRLFIITFDTIVTKPVLRNELILQFLSVQGFINSEFFTLMLFDILNNSHKLSNVTKAVMVHFDSLLLVFYLFVATTFVYASFGLQYFPEDFTTVFNGSTKSFKTVLSAFWFLFHNFSSRGMLNSYLHTVVPKGSNWLPRIAFDTAYFVWVGIILFTTITALLVDALSKARTEAALRDSEEKNVCFMCGLKRSTYDDYGLAPGSPSFDDHCGKEHDPWMYVAYLAHLNRRRRLKCTGAEEFAKRAIANHSFWTPSKTSFVLEAQEKAAGNQQQHNNATAPQGEGLGVGGAGGACGGRNGVAAGGGGSRGSGKNGIDPTRRESQGALAGASASV